MCPAVLQDARGCLQKRGGGAALSSRQGPAQHRESRDCCARKHLSVCGDFLPRVQLGSWAVSESPSPSLLLSFLCVVASGVTCSSTSSSDANRQGSARVVENKTDLGRGDVCPRSQNEYVTELGVEAWMPGDPMSMNEHKNQCKRLGELCAWAGGAQGPRAGAPGGM